MPPATAAAFTATPRARARNVSHEGDARQTSVTTLPTSAPSKTLAIAQLGYRRISIPDKERPEQHRVVEGGEQMMEFVSVSVDIFRIELLLETLLHCTDRQTLQEAPEYQPRCLIELHSKRIRVCQPRRRHSGDFFNPLLDDLHGIGPKPIVDELEDGCPVWEAE
jgi:hypothetical protein